MPCTVTSILLVGDSPDVLAVVRGFCRSGEEDRHTLTVVPCLADAEQKLRHSVFDVVMLDWKRPDSRTLAGVRRIRGLADSAALVVLCAADDAALAAEALQHGVQDYLVTSALTRESLSRAIRYAIEWRKMRAHMQEERAFLRAVLDSLSSRVAVLDADGVIVVANKAWERFARQSGDPCLAQPGAGLSYPDVCERARGPDADGARTVAPRLRGLLEGGGKPVSHEYECASPAGTRWFVLRAAPLVDSKPGVLLSHEDITARKVAEQERLRQAETERQDDCMRRAVQAMDHVLGVVGHELRTPLASVRAMSELLLEDVHAAQQPTQRFLTSIRDEATRMSEMVTNLLDVARFNSGAIQWQWGTLDVPSIIRGCIETMRPLQEASGVELRYEASSSNLTMNGDGSAIRRLILNLVSNAQRHTPAGSITVDAVAEDTREGRYVAVGVRDTGTGIAHAVVRRLGEAFTLNAILAGDHPVAGAGLGLAICRGIAAAHGGSISVETAPNRGTVVTVRLRADLDGPQAGARAQPIVVRELA